MVATIVTSLEMVNRPKLRPVPAAPFRLTRWKTPSPARYRALFRRVGEPWLWFSRLVMADDILTAIIHNEATEIYAVEDKRGVEIGILELDFRVAREVEISFFGFVPELAGQGHGNWLMDQTLAIGWRKDIERMWVHSCTLDHPGALRFYCRHGFVPFERAIETFSDPRLSGILSRDAAPHVPLIDQPSASLR